MTKSQMTAAIASAATAPAAMHLWVRRCATASEKAIGKAHYHAVCAREAGKVEEMTLWLDRRGQALKAAYL